MIKLQTRTSKATDRKTKSTAACMDNILYFQSFIMKANMFLWLYIFIFSRNNVWESPKNLYQPQLLFQWEGEHWNEIKEELLVGWVMYIQYLYTVKLRCKGGYFLAIRQEKQGKR